MQNLEKQPNYFASGKIDRASYLRQDEAWLFQQFNSNASLFIPLWQSKNYFLRGENSGSFILQKSEVQQVLDNSFDPIFLGLDSESPIFAIDFSGYSDPFDAVRCKEKVFVDDLKKWGALLPRDQAALLAYARGMVYWHQRYKFCGTCGSKTLSRDGGHFRECQDRNCKAQYFSRTDPAIIVLITSGEKCLLGRQAGWQEGVYSTLAGFIEPGESLEDAVKREIMEEVGLPLEKIVYHSSQPWPFPSSLMIGFTAVAAHEKIQIDNHEIEDARWFTREIYLQELEKGLIRMPSQVSIARRLVEEWLSIKSDL